MTWLAALERHRRRGDACVLVTIVGLEGSGPRGVGARMLVSGAGSVDTVGGGALEHAARAHARAMLETGGSAPRVEHRRWTLGRALSQCCGGRATLAFEYLPPSDFRLEVFGAGHVARELAALARRLPCIATFHDPRIGWLARIGADEPVGTVPDLDLGPAPAEGPGTVRASVLAENVHGAVERCRPGGLYLVMTHSHELDLEVCEAVLSRGDARYLGLIASGSKARAFRGRLARKGFTDAELEGLTAPLGRATGVATGNTPMEVAVAAMADVLTARERARSAAPAAGAAPATAARADASRASAPEVPDDADARDAPPADASGAG